MSDKTKPHHFGSAREMTPEEKESVDAAFKGLKVCHPRIEQIEKQIREQEAAIAIKDKSYTGLYRDYEQLKASNKQLLSALEWTIEKYSEELREHYDIGGFYDLRGSDEVEKAIANAKQVMGDRG